MKKISFSTISLKVYSGIYSVLTNMSVFWEVETDYIIKCS